MQFENLANVDVKEKEIGGNTYYVRPFAPFKSLELLGDLQAVITSSFGSAVGTQGEGEEDGGKSITSMLEQNIDVGAIIAGIGKNLKGPALVSFANRIIDKEYVSIKRSTDESPVKFDKNISDNVFSGRLTSMFALMHFVLEVNYADFFENIPDLTGLLQEIGKMKK